MEPIRALVIGLGTHARQGHVDHFPRSGIDLVAAVDSKPSVVDDFRRQYPGTYESATEYAAFLRRGDINAVFIMTPDRCHAQQTLDALNAGKNVFCEKPMADPDTMDRFQEAMRLAASRRLVLTSCHPRRLDPPFMWLERNLPGFIAKLGQPLEFRFDLFYVKPSKGGLHDGLLIDHFGHEIDLLHKLFGQVPFTAARQYDSQDRYSVAGVRSDGMTFLFGGTRMLQKTEVVLPDRSISPRYPETATVRFARGELVLDTGLGTARLRDFEEGTVEELRCGKTDYARRFQAVNRNFAEAIHGLASNYLTPNDLMVNTLSAVALSRTGHYAC